MLTGDGRIVGWCINGVFGGVPASGESWRGLMMESVPNALEMAGDERSPETRIFVFVAI